MLCCTLFGSVNVCSITINMRKPHTHSDMFIATLYRCPLLWPNRPGVQSHLIWSGHDDRKTHDTPDAGDDVRRVHPTICVCMLCAVPICCGRTFMIHEKRNLLEPTHTHTTHIYSRACLHALPFERVRRNNSILSFIAHTRAPIMLVAEEGRLKCIQTHRSLIHSWNKSTYVQLGNMHTTINYSCHTSLLEWCVCVCVQNKNVHRAEERQFNDEIACD